MPTFSKYAFAAASIAAVLNQAFAQNWQKLQALRSEEVVAESLFAIDVSEIRDIFGNIEASASRVNNNLKLPMPNGGIGKFHLETAKYSTMSPALAARFPNIKVYEGIGVDANDDVNIVSAVYSDSGLFAQYLKPDGSVAYLDTVGSIPDAGLVNVRSYNHVRGFSNNENSGECHVNDVPKSLPSPEEAIEMFQSAPKLQGGCHSNFTSLLGNFRCESYLNTPECNYDAGDCCGGYSSKFECVEEKGKSCECINPDVNVDTLTKYRIAIAATVEYSTFHGNTTESVLAALVTTMARVNGLYKRELAVYMELVNDTTLLFDLPGQPVRFSNQEDVIDNSTTLFNSIIGNTSYDIGHVVSTASGGVAMLGSVCSAKDKAGGTTGQAGPVGDPFDIDYVAHEIGHQFQGDHTFAGCDDNPGSNEFRYEPGSGSTIMAYAGICGDDDLSANSDPMFHSASIEQIKRFINNPLTGGSCGEVLRVDIPRPVLNPDLSFPPTRKEPLRKCAIPQDTPFRLEAINAPVDETSYHYTWEQSIDSEEISNIHGPQQDSTILFRAATPKRFTAARTFPSLDTVVSGRQDLSERLPTMNRSIGFALTVRSYFNSNGNLAEDLTQDVGIGTTYIGDFVHVNVTSFRGEPLRVAQPAGSISFGGHVDVSWSGGIAGDTGRILLSLDGGETFPFVVAQSIKIAAGSAKVKIFTGKGLTCNSKGFTEARLMVQSINEATPGCSYFNVNPADIVVDSCGTFPTAAPTPPTQSPTFVTQAPTTGPPPPQFFELIGEGGYFSDEGVFANETEALTYDPLPPYLPDVDHVYTIIAPPGKRVMVEFTYFYTEPDYDYVYVIEGNNTYIDDYEKRYSGSLVTSNATAPLRYESKGNILTVRFISDPGVEEAGFVARYTTTSARRLDDGVEASVDVVSTLSGFETIQLDSFFQDKVPSGYHGQWFYATSSGTIRLSFDKFDVGYGTGIIRVYDGPSSESPLLRVVTGNEVPTPVQSSGHAMFVTFKAPNGGGRGFAGSITTVGATMWYWVVGIGVATVTIAGLIIGIRWNNKRKARELEADFAREIESLGIPHGENVKLKSGNPLYINV